MSRTICLLLAAITANFFASVATAQTPPVAANGCLMCHGIAGQGSNGIPAIMKVQSGADFTTTMMLFAENKKPGTIMGRVARGYTDEDMAALAAWFGK